MSFFDKPIIDKYAINSGASERKLEEFLNQGTGFICRRDVPDKGVDYDIELITERSNASGWRFGLQLKSIEYLSLITDGQNISYSFETSRLGYLMARLPAMGLIALYSVEQDIVYYDFVDRIYERLMDERGNTDWYTNDKVNIRIPVANELAKESVIDIHRIFVNRFEQAAVMQQSHGSKYNLPAVNLSGEFKYDFNNLDHLEKMLHEYGLLLLSMYDLQMVYDLIVRIPNVDIVADKDLLLIAAIAYCEVGKHPDSVFYINKLLRRKDLSDDETQMTDFTALKNSLALGHIDIAGFVKEMTKLKNGKLSPVNEITLEINATFYELLDVKTLHTIPQHLIQSIQSVFDRIKQLGCADTVKYLIEIWNAENFAVLLSNFRHKHFGELRIREAMGGGFSLTEKKERVEFLASLQNQMFSIIDRMDNIANDTGNKLIKAYTLALHTRVIISQEIDYISYLFPVPKSAEHKRLFINYIHSSLTGYNLFLDLNQFKDAYHMLCYTLELLEIANTRYKYEDIYNRDQLLEVKKQMEESLELDEYNMVIPELFERQKEQFRDENPKSMAFVKEMDDMEIENFGKMAFDAYHLPNHQLVNIINEMKAYKIFYTRCTDESYDIFAVYNHTRTMQNAYAAPVKFVLRSRKTGLETASSAYIEDLLRACGL